MGNGAHHSRRFRDCQPAAVAPLFESGFGLRKSIASVFESKRIYVYSAAEGAVNIGDGDQGEREQERERKYLHGVEFEVFSAE
jgi:hypothetical protein